ncbi:hypothetical protein FKM82_011427 [Ascaphus truei]
MSRRHLEEAFTIAKDLERSGEHVDEKSDEGQNGRFSELYVRHHVPLSKDIHSIYSLHFNSTGTKLAVGFGNGSIQIVNVEEGSLDVTIVSGHRTSQPITAVRYHPKSNNLLLAAGADGMIFIYDIKSELNVVSLTEQENEINALDFCQDGSVFATAGKDRHIRLYDSNTNKVLNILEAPDFLLDNDLTLTSGHSCRIFALKFHPSEYHIFLTGGWDDSIKIWDKRMSKEARRVIIGPHVCGPGIDIEDNRVLTGSWVARKSLQLWDLRSSQLLQDVPFPATAIQGEFLYAARFCSGNVVVAGGSGTCRASAVDLQTQEVIGEVSLANKPVQVVDVASDGRVVAVAGVGGNLHIAELC